MWSRDIARIQWNLHTGQCADHCVGETIMDADSTQNKWWNKSEMLPSIKNRGVKRSKLRWWEELPSIFCRGNNAAAALASRQMQMGRDLSVLVIGVEETHNICNIRLCHVLAKIGEHGFVVFNILKPSCRQHTGLHIPELFVELNTQWDLKLTPEEGSVQHVDRPHQVCSRATQRHN